MTKKRVMCSPESNEPGEGMEFQERTHNLKMKKQKLFFKNHEMQEEIRK